VNPIVWRLPFSGGATLLPAGCIHHPHQDKALFKEWIHALKTTRNGVSILMGDALDQERTHYREHLRSYRADSNSQAALDRHHRRDVEDLAKLLLPVKGKLIGAISGNHYHEFMDGTTSDQYLCRLLGIPFLGPMGCVRLDFMNSQDRVAHRMVVTAHHNGGSRGSRTMGADVNALGRFGQVVESSIYLLSHTHQCHGHKKDILTVNGANPPVVEARTICYVRTGAFLKGYDSALPTNNAPYFPGYAELAAYPPTTLGFVKIHIDLKQGASTLNGSRQSTVTERITLEF
jgi:hypothetical protein